MANNSLSTPTAPSPSRVELWQRSLRLIRETYGFLLARQVLRECWSWSIDQLMPLLIALIGIWLAVHWGLLPVIESKAAYETRIWPFIVGLGLYMLVQVVRAPYVLHREQKALIKELEPYKERNWRPLNEDEKETLANRLGKMGKHCLSITYNDKPDCGDVAEDFTEVFLRAGWNQPCRAGVSYDSIGARDVVVIGKKTDQLASIVVRAISESTYIKPLINDALPENAFASTGVLEGKEIKNPIDLIVRIAPIKRK